MNNVEKLLFEIHKEIAEIENKRKENKERFNFFTAIVSGKHSKDHHEKYHSNVIAYLLDPHQSHDFGKDFQDCFFEMLKNNYEVDDIRKDKKLKVERERKTDEGRFIDISMEYEKDCIVFIENKIASVELDSQMKDYSEFASSNFTNWIGIFLTINGDKAASVTNNEGTIDKNKVKSISYHDIINWLEICCQKIDSSKHLHIVSCLKQYISILNRILNIMQEDKKKIIQIILSSSENIDAAKSILNDTQLKWTDIINEIMEQLRSRLRVDYNNPDSQLEIAFVESDNQYEKYKGGFRLYKKGWKNCIYFYFEEGGYAKMYVSIDIMPNQPSTLGKSVREEVIEWNDYSWSEIEKMMPNVIKNWCTIFIERYENYLVSGDSSQLK